MNKQYIFTEAEYCAIRANILTTYNSIKKRVDKNYEDYNVGDMMACHDLKYALDILDGDIELKDGM